MSIFKAIVGHTRSLAPRPHGNTVALDADMQCAYASLLDNFKYRPLGQYLIDTAKDL